MWKWSLLPLLLCLLSLACTDGPTAEPTAGIIRSETVPPQPASTQPSADTAAQPEAAPDERAEPDAPTTGDTPTELSTDPDIVYQADTCHEPPAPGRVAEQLDCAIPHTVEVYAVRDLPGGPDAPFLGLDAAIDLCDEDFTRITGVGIGLATTFRRSVLRPSEETWALGEREVTCFVVFHPVALVGHVGIGGLVGVEDGAGELAEAGGQVAEQSAGALSLMVEGEVHAQPELGVVLEQRVGPGRSPAGGVGAPGGGGEVGAVDRRAAGGVCDHPRSPKSWVSSFR